MKFSSLHDLYIEQLKDLHSAETQLTKALPQMANAANTPKLKAAFTAHLKETKEQLVRLNQIAEKLGKSLKGHTCAAMKALIAEGSAWMEEDAAPELVDAGLVAAAQRVEHYEMAGYVIVHNFSELLGEEEAAELLAETLHEEEAAEEKLTTLAKSINVEAKVRDLSSQTPPEVFRYHRDATPSDSAVGVEFQHSSDSSTAVGQWGSPIARRVSAVGVDV